MLRAVHQVMRALADGGMTILPDTHVITYSDADGGLSLDCWVVPNTVTALVRIGASGVAQHVPLELEVSLPFPEGTSRSTLTTYSRIPMVILLSEYPCHRHVFYR